ncbi:MAG TPA: DUF2938 domain-containing protein [Marinobacterium sp.]|nr:DUF2938 domain-containing protein [Marinobacterium sp.]
MNLSAIELGILMGIGGTVAMDIWALIQHWVFKMPLPNWGNPGRWFAHLPTIFHEDISKLPEVKNEVAIGWAFHYAVGIIYGIAWILIAGEDWIANPTFLPLWIFALVTIAAGWFLLHPGMGLGWALSKTPTPWKGRFLGLVAHTVFGLGMWLPALMH